jgi:c-di-GMP-binding flagellar brake protein YcgR
MTSLVNFSGLCDYEEFRINDSEHIVLMLRDLQRQHTPVYLFFTDDQPVTSRIIEVDETQGDVVMAYTGEMSRIPRLNASGIFVVADHAHTQVQYHVESLAQRPGGVDSDFLLPLPDSLYVIQRRTSLRREIPEADHVVCLLAAGNGEPGEYPVLDISEEGLALLDVDGRFPAGAGEVLEDVVLKLPEGEVRMNLTLANRFSIYLPEQNRRVGRVGGITAGLDEAGRGILNRYLARLNSI